MTSVGNLRTSHLKPVKQKKVLEYYSNVVTAIPAADTF